MKPSILKLTDNNDVECIKAKVKWYSSEKGYGFLSLDDDSEDIFLHFSVLQTTGYKNLKEGSWLICDVGPAKLGRQVLCIREVEHTCQETPSLLDLSPENLKEIPGKVKWFNPTKKYGFICPDDGGEDIFLRASVVHAAGYISLKPGTSVLVTVSNSEEKCEATTIKVINS